MSTKGGEGKGRKTRALVLIKLEGRDGISEFRCREMNMANLAHLDLSPFSGANGIDQVSQNDTVLDRSLLFRRRLEMEEGGSERLCSRSPRQQSHTSRSFDVVKSP